LRDNKGLTTVEYIIILCLIAVVGFGVWKKFGEKVKEKVGGSTEQVDELPTTTEE
jgi:Flp pilus assembly pilin Flp